MLKTRAWRRSATSPRSARIRLPETRIAFHPAARLLRFATPAASVWASAQSSDRSGRANRGAGRRRAHHASRLRRPRARPAAAWLMISL